MKKQITPFILILSLFAISCKKDNIEGSWKIKDINQKNSEIPVALFVISDSLGPRNLIFTKNEIIITNDLNKELEKSTYKMIDKNKIELFYGETKKSGKVIFDKEGNLTLDFDSFSYILTKTH